MLTADMLLFLEFSRSKMIRLSLLDPQSTCVQLSLHELVSFEYFCLITAVCGWNS